MARENPKFDTIEDMVQWSLNNPRNDSRFELSKKVEWEWDNPEAGTAWREESDRLYNIWSAAYYRRNDSSSVREYSDEQIAALKKTQEDYSKNRPSMHRNTEYHLSEVGHGYHRLWIPLSVELGEQIEKVWTKKASRYGGGEELTGRMMVRGILFRLGKTDIRERIQAQILKSENAQKRMTRNSYRKNIAQKASELIDLITRAKELGIPVSYHSELADLMKLGDQVEEQ